MEVDVKLFATFQKGRFARRQLTVPEKATVSDLLRLLDIAADDVGILVVNHRDATLKQPLDEGDRITIIPVIGGG